jgi:hypothetical protein
VQSDQSKIIASLQILLADGYEPAQVAKQLSVLTREDVLLNKPLLKRDISFPLLRKLVDVPSSIEPSIDLEIALLETVNDNSLTVQSITDRTVEPKLSGSGKLTKVDSSESAVIESTTVNQKGLSKKKSSTQSPKTTITDPDKLWDQLLEVIKKDHNTLYGILRMARPEFSGTLLKLNFGFKFHQQRVKEIKNRQTITQILLDLNGQNYTIECVVDESAKPDMPTEIPIIEGPFMEEDNQVPVSPLETINSIFGGGEVIGQQDGSES